MGKVKAKAEAAPKEENADKEEEQEEDTPAVKQLKEIDDKYLALEKEFERAREKLKTQFVKRQQPLLDERKKVLTVGADGPVTGTPALSGFWLKAMQNHPAFEDLISEWDHPVLEFLQDIEKSQEDSEKGFMLTFRFLENPYFENTELTKEYILEESNPYVGELDVKEIKCSTINWKPGKNVTVEKVVKKVKGGGAKKQKAKGKEKEEPRPSFFRDFFRSMKPDMKLPDDAKEQVRGQAMDDDDDDDDDEEMIAFLMSNDHEVGTELRDSIIPFAIRWYTGEAAPNYERMEDDEDDDEDSDEDETESDDEPPPKARGKGGAKASAKKGAKTKASPSASPETKPSDPPKEECKQQ